jgi:hypothetical protein
VTQLDLFGQVMAREQRRYRDTLVCLRDVVPTALEVVTTLQYGFKQDTKGSGRSGGWGYNVCQAGVRVESITTWRGFNHAPRNLVTWDELADLVGTDPRRAEITAWADSLPMPRWRQLMRPHELWPDPGGWHVSYFCGDHVDVHWPARRRAWQLLSDLLTDAINVRCSK